jgi:predicted permease
MSGFLQDLRYGLRMLARNPGFSAVAVLTLALGIGANTAIFSVVDAVLLAPLPYDQPGQLVQLWEDDLDGRGEARNTVSGPAFAAWREENKLLENLAAYTPVALNLTGDGRPERLRGLRVSASYLQVFRVKPLLGRGFLPEEDRRGTDKVVLLTHGLWQRRFGGDTNLVGRTIQLGGEGRAVIGILPPKPALAAEREFFVPLALDGESRARNRGDHWLRVVARLKPGTTPEQARTELNTITQQQNQINPPTQTDTGATVVPLQEQLVGEMRSELVAGAWFGSC